MIPDIPGSVKKAMERQEYRLKLALGGEEAEDEDPDVLEPDAICCL